MSGDALQVLLLLLSLVCTKKNPTQMEPFDKDCQWLTRNPPPPPRNQENQSEQRLFQFNLASFSVINKDLYFSVMQNASKEENNPSGVPPASQNEDQSSSVPPGGLLPYRSPSAINAGGHPRVTAQNLEQKKTFF